MVKGDSPLAEVNAATFVLNAALLASQGSTRFEASAVHPYPLNCGENPRSRAGMSRYGEYLRFHDKVFSLRLYGAKFQ